MKISMVICFTLLPIFLFAQFFVVDQNPNSVTVEFQMKNFSEQNVEIDGKNYVLLGFEGAFLEENPGKPAVPYLSSRLAVPPGSKISFEMFDLEKSTLEGIDLAPQSIMFLRGDFRQVPADPKIYQRTIPYPEKRVVISKAYEFRGVNVVSVTVKPVQYFPRAHRIQIAQKFRVRFSFNNGSEITTPRIINSGEFRLFSHKILNYRQAGLFSSPASRSFKKLSANYDFSSGKWFRIPVKTEGIYQITGSFLKSNGVDIGKIRLANAHLYNYGGNPLSTNVLNERPSDLNEIAVRAVDENNNGVMDENDRIIFYGRGLGNWQFDESLLTWKFLNFPYDDTNYYLFSFDDRVGKRIVDSPSPQLANPEVPVTFTDYFRFEEDHYNILSSGSDWYWLKMSGLSDHKTAELDLPQNLADGKTKMVFRFKGGSGSFYGDNEPYRYDLRAILNGEVVINNYTLTRNSAGISTVSKENLFALKGGKNTLEIQHTGNLSGCEVYLDYLEVNLERPFTSENEQLRFRKIIGNNVPVEFRISGMPAGTNFVWDLTDFADIKNIEPISNGQSVVFQDVDENLKGGEYFVFSGNSIQNVAGIEALENHPNLRDPSRKAEFLIITPDEFYEDAAFLEDWRESQIPNPLQTERVRLSEIFQEFSSSVRDVVAIRDFIKYVYENWSDTLKYVLLFGDGHYDYRQIQLKDWPNYIPPFEIANNSEVDSRESDNFFVALGMRGSTDNIDPWLPIGRLPVNTPEQIQVFKEKEANYRQSFLVDPEKNGWQTWITLVADDQFGGIGQNNEWFHLQPTEEVYKKLLPHKFNTTKIYLHDYDRIAGGLGRWKPKATEDLINQINRGTILINYFGHGDPDTWAHESVLNRSRDLPKFHNEDRLPLWVAITCTWGKYDDPNHTSMSEELIWLPQKGGIGIVSASRPVFVFSNVQFAKDFYRYLFRTRSEIQPSRLLGDAFFLALRGEGARNYQKYHLYGDPTMRLADPEHVVKITAIHPDTLKALSTITVEAVVTGNSGEVLPDFNGQAVLHCFDAVDSQYVAAAKLHYIYHGGTIFKGVVSVSGGKMSGSFIVPKSIKYKKDYTGRISIYAWNDQTDAVGFVDTLLVYGTEKQVTDAEGPQIDIGFKDAPNFFNGDFLSNQPTLEVELSDENGINLTGEVGHKIELTIDGKVKRDVTEFFVYKNNSYQTGNLEFTLPALSTGNHDLKISSWDNLNNFSEQNVSFRTSAVTELSLTEVVNFPNPFTNDTYFTFQMISPAGEAETTIGIYTVSGRKIQEIHDIARQGFNKIYWDGRDWDGDLIANGVYFYKIIVDNGDRKIEKIEKMAVIR